MNLIEFSIACKLISLKLRNVEVPKLLPPTLLASLKHVGTPIRTPTGSMSPVEGYKQFLPPAQQPAPAAVPLITQQQQQQLQYQQQQIIQQTQMLINQAQQPPQLPMMVPQAIPQIPPDMIAQQPMMMMQPQIVPMPPAVPIIPTGTVQPMMTNSITKPPLLEQLSSGSLLDSLSQVQPMVVASGPLPAAPTPTPPQSGHASRSMSFSEKAPSVPESP